MPEGRREMFEKIYTATREQLRRLLFSTGPSRISEFPSLITFKGFNFAHVVGVEWRLDYYIKSDKLDRIDVPICASQRLAPLSHSHIPFSDVINIKTEENGQTKDVQFACTQEELQDLVTKLKQAVKEVDRIVQG